MISIVYGDVAKGAGEGAEYADNGHQTYADTSVLSNGATPRHIATGEVGRWKLDGSTDILGYMSANYGYVSEAISDASGNYHGDIGIDISLDGNYASTGITITFDALEDVTYSVKIEWYNGNTKVAEKTVDASGECVIENSVSLYNALKIRFLASSKPYRFARIEKVLYGIGRRFVPSDFDSIHLTQELNPISSDLAIDTSKFVLRPQKNIQYIFQTRQTFKIYRDNTLIAAHYLSNAKTESKNKYTVECQSLVGLLEDMTFSAARMQCTAFEAAGQIMGDIPFEMDESLKNIAVDGYIEDCTRREALHQLLFAIGAVCSTADGENIRIFAIPQAAYTLDADKTYAGASIEQEKIVTAVKITYHSLSNTSRSGAKQIKIGYTTYYDTQGVITVNNPAVLSGTPDNIIEIGDATLLNQIRANAIKGIIADHYFGGVTVTEKRIMQSEALGDRVAITDALGESVTGVITSRDTAITNLYASTIKVVGKHATD